MYSQQPPPQQPQQQQQAHSVIFSTDTPTTADPLQFYSGNQYGYPQQPQPQIYAQQPMGNMTQMEGRVFVGSPFGTAGYADEPPLLEELGVNFGHIWSKSLSVLNVIRTPDKHIMDDTDLAGPIFFCILFGAFLLLSGKVQFGFIYGVATLGWLFLYAILNLMCEDGIDGWRTASVLGYSLLPMVILSGLSMLLKLQGWVGLILSCFSILWCTYSASLIFVTVLSMKDQRFLVAYPVGLLYACFALLTVF